jgi:hypothetical protein
MLVANAERPPMRAPPRPPGLSLLAPALSLLCACPRSNGDDDGLARAGALSEAGEVDAEPPRLPDASAMTSDASPDLDAATPLDSGTSVDGGGSPVGPGACPALTSGWARYYPTTTVQFQGAGTNNQYCTYRNDGGVEYFQLDKNPALLIQRCEARVNNDYLSGKNQFEGDVLVTEADNMCVHQVFNFLMVVAYPQDGGVFHEHSGTLLQSGVFGHWVHVNTIHDTETHTIQIYLDCVHVYDGTDSPAPSDAGWYDKYGLYGIQGIPPQEPTSIVEWTKVAYYQQP